MSKCSFYLERGYPLKDSRFKDFEYCEYRGIYKKLPSSNCTYQIDIYVKETPEAIFGEYHRIYINSSELKSKLQLFMDRKTERLYFSFGMADIDVFYNPYKEKYVIENSPCDSVYMSYYLSKEDIKRLLSDLG